MTWAQECWTMYADIARIAVPITFIFGACNISFDMIYNAFTSGHFKFGGHF